MNPKSSKYEDTNDQNSRIQHKSDEISNSKLGIFYTKNENSNILESNENRNKSNLNDFINQTEFIKSKLINWKPIPQSEIDEHINIINRMKKNRETDDKLVPFVEVPSKNITKESAQFSDRISLDNYGKHSKINYANYEIVKPKFEIGYKKNENSKFKKSNEKLNKINSNAYLKFSEFSKLKLIYQKRNSETVENIASSVVASSTNAGKFNNDGIEFPDRISLENSDLLNSSKILSDVNGMNTNSNKSSETTKNLEFSRKSINHEDSQLPIDRNKDQNLLHIKKKHSSMLPSKYLMNECYPHKQLQDISNLNLSRKSFNENSLTSKKFSFNDKNIVDEISVTEIQQKKSNSLLSDKTNSETSQINQIRSHVLDKSISNNEISNLFCNSISPIRLNGNTNLSYDLSLKNKNLFEKYDFLKHYMIRRDKNILPLIDLGISQIFHFVKSQSGDLSKIFDNCHRNMPKEFQKCNSPERIIRIYDQWRHNKESGDNTKCFINRLRIYEAVFETMKKIYLKNEIFGITENKFSFFEITEDMKLQRVTDMVMDRLKSMRIFYGNEVEISRDPRYKWFYKDLSEVSQLIIDQMLPNYSKRNELMKIRSIIKILKQNGTIQDTIKTLE